MRNSPVLRATAPRCVIFVAFLLSRLAGTGAFAAPGNVDAALAKCREFEKMTPAQLQKIADENHLPVKTIQSDCYQLEHRDELGKDPSYLLSVCRGFARMTPPQLAKVAQDNHTTVAAIRQACYTIAHPSPGGGTGGSSGGSTAPDNSSPCSCMSTQVCVRSGGGYTCQDPAGSGNQCSVSTDCGQNPVRGLSNCISGQCT